MGLTKKQINAIAIIWGAGMLINAGTDSFIDEGLTIDDENKILDRTHKIGRLLLNGLPKLNSLTEIIEYAKTH